MNASHLRTALAALLCVAAAAPTHADGVTWLNETDAPLECDYCVLQWPASTTINVFSEQIYGRLYEAGVTEAPGAAAGVLAQVGIGPLGSDPRLSAGWHWFAATYNLQVGNDDEYRGSVLGYSLGQQSYTFRFSLDGGQSYTLADLDGAGSNAGLVFSRLDLGQATVMATAVPEPASQGLLLGGLALLGLLARRRAG